MHSPSSQTSVNRALSLSNQEETEKQSNLTWSPIYNQYKWQFIFRSFWLIWMLFILIAGAIAHFNIGFYVAFTMYGVYFTTITFICLFVYSVLSERLDQNVKRILSKIWLILFTISLTWEVIITIVFWTVLTTRIKMFDNLFYFWDDQYHIFPLLSLMIEFLTNKWKFEYIHLIHIAVWSLWYGIINLLYVLITGRVIYPFLTWKDWRSYIAVFAISITLVILHLSFTWISHCKAKQRDIKYEEMNKEL